MDFGVISCLLFLALAVYAVFKGKGVVLSLIIACEYLMSNSATKALISLSTFGGDASFYVWYLFSGGLCLVIAFLLAFWFIHFDREKPTAYASLIYFLYSILSLLIIVQYIPVGDSFPFEFLGAYENYKTLHHIFTVLLLLCICHRTGITGNAKRIFTNRGSKLSDSNILHSSSISANQGCSKIGDDS